MLKILLTSLMITSLMAAASLYGQNTTFTQEDRERLVRLETKIEESQRAINQRFDAIIQRFDDIIQRFDDINQRFGDINNRIDDSNQRIDDLREDMRDLKTFMLWGFGILFVGIFGLITVVIWDRRTALTPVIRKSKELEQRDDLVEKVLKDYARVEPKFAEILKNAGML